MKIRALLAILSVIPAEHMTDVESVAVNEQGVNIILKSEPKSKAKTTRIPRAK